MNTITFSPSMTAKQLYTLCKEHGIKFKGFREKIAKRYYIEALTAFNAAIESQAVQTIKAITINTIIFTVALGMISRDIWQYIRREQIIEKAIGYSAIAFSLFLVQIYNTSKYWVALTNDDRPLLQFISDAVKQ